MKILKITCQKSETNLDNTWLNKEKAAHKNDVFEEIKICYDQENYAILIDDHYQVLDQQKVITTSHGSLNIVVEENFTTPVMPPFLMNVQPESFDNSGPRKISRLTRKTDQGILDFLYTGLSPFQSASFEAQNSLTLKMEEQKYNLLALEAESHVIDQQVPQKQSPFYPKDKIFSVKKVNF